MHELSIAQSLVEVALSHLPLQAGGVAALHLNLGRLSGVEPAALQFSYDLVTEGTRLQGSRLVIRDIPVRVYCAHCDQEGEVLHVARMRCPQCGELSGDIRAGKELELSAIDLQEDLHSQR